MKPETFHRILITGAIFCAVLFLLRSDIGTANPNADDEVVALVNNFEITRTQFDFMVLQFQKTTQQKEIGIPEKKELLLGLIRRHLLLNLEEVNALRKDKIIVRNVREYENSQILKRYLETQIGPKVTVTEKEIKTYYQENLHQFSTPPKVKARHILLRTREDAEKVAALLKDGGDFKELAKQYSIDLPAALEGGTMGTIEKGKTLPEVGKVLFILDTGEISDIVKTRYGYHILTVDEIMTAEFKPYETVRDQIKQFLLRRKETAAFTEMTAKLEQQADIKIFEDRLAEAAP